MEKGQWCRFERDGVELKILLPPGSERTREFTCIWELHVVRAVEPEKVERCILLGTTDHDEFHFIQQLITRGDPRIADLLFEFLEQRDRGPILCMDRITNRPYLRIYPRECPGLTDLANVSKGEGEKER